MKSMLTVLARLLEARYVQKLTAYQRSLVGAPGEVEWKPVLAKRARSWRVAW